MIHKKRSGLMDYGVDDLKTALVTQQSDGNKLINKLDDKFEIRMMKARN